MRATEKHNLEMQILREQLREAKAKADLAELVLKEKLDSTSWLDKFFFFVYICQFFLFNVFCFVTGHATNN